MKNKFPELKALGMGVGLAAFSIFLYYLGAFRGFELFIEDTLISPTGASPEIVIITIDDNSISQIGQWPWPRAEYAKLFAALDEYPPRVLGLDVLLSEESRAGKADDNSLARVLADLSYPVVMAGEGEGLKPLEIFSANSQVSVGNVHLLLDPDSIVRRVDLTGSFAAHMVSSSSEGVVRIAYGGVPGTFRRVSFIEAQESESVRKSLEGKIVLVGSTASDLHDEQQTPVSKGRAMPGVEIQANIANMILSGNKLNERGSGFVITLIILAILIPIVLFAIFSHLLAPILLSLGAYLVALVITIIIFDRGVVFNVFYPTLAGALSLVGSIIYRYFGSERQGREVRELFGKYVSSEVLEEILRNPKEVKLGGEEREVTILFSDIRGFTTLSEQMTPIELTTFMNRYLSRMTEIILENKGVVDKYIGDAIMAFWGAPLENKLHQKFALKAALEMAEALDKFNEKSAKENLPPIEIGLGLNSGKVVAGNMGSTSRMSYTIMGDSVNLASRLEGITKLYGVRVIASRAVLGASTPEEFAEQGIFVREIDRVRVKGKSEPVTIYEVVRPAKRLEVESIKSRFDLARDYYYKGGWDKCLKLLAEIDTIVPGDGPSKVLRERCLQFKVMAPTHWDGVYEHKTK